MKINNTIPEEFSIPQLLEHTIQQFNCQGCGNQCLISKLTFTHNKVFFTGNKCEKIFTNKGIESKKGTNHFTFRLDLLNSFISPNNPNNSITIGIPRALNMFENFPF